MATRSNSDKKIAGTLALVLVAILALAACQPVTQSTSVPTVPAATVEVPVTGQGTSTAAAGVTPSVTVKDQAVSGGSVTVAEVVSNGPGWIVIHQQKDGKTGPVAGYAAVKDGKNENVMVKLDESLVTPTMYAMLHTDVGQVGTYEFPGADGPVLIGESMVSPAFQIIGASSATQDSSSSSSGGGLYGSDNSGSSGSSSSSSTSSDAGELRVSQNADLGTFLTDGKGMTLYIFVKDAPNKSNCSGGCLQAWPPLVVNSADEVKAEDGVDASKIGTIPFSGGGLQVTYNQKPLYYWAEDMNPGDVNGQGVNNTWYVLKP